MKIMCIHRSVFVGCDTNKLITGFNALAILEQMNLQRLYMERDLLELNPEYRQPIPYILLRRGTRYLLIKRTSKQGEKRLHNKYSLGIGGHVEDQESICEATERELAEETGIEAELEFKGIILETNSAVADVHVGIFFD